MRKSSEARWSLTKPYYSTGSTSAAMAQRFFQTLRKQPNKPAYSLMDSKEKSRSFKLSLTEEPKYLLSRRSNKTNSQMTGMEPLHSQRSFRQSLKQPTSSKISTQENKVHRLKDKFQSVLKRKNCLCKLGPVTSTEVKIAINGMGILPLGHKHFNQLQESVEEMMSVASSTLSAVNLFIILLGFQNMQVTQKELSWMLLSEQDRRQIIKLTRKEVSQMHQMYSQLNGFSSPAQVPLIISITLPNRQREQNVFSGRESLKEIAGSLMSKYNIPQKKRKNMERIIFNKLHQKVTI